MTRTKRREKRAHNLLIDNSAIKVSFEELFFDLIFVIVLGKISSIVVESEQLTIVTLVTSVVLFCVFVFSWMFRLIHNNQVHILSNKFGQTVANLKRLTYIELIIILVLLHEYETLTFGFMISIIILVILVTILTMSQVRSFVSEYFKNDREKFFTIISKVRDRNTSLINIEYICERYGVILILFLGEILATSFSGITNTFKFMAVAILIVYLFNDVSNLLKYIPNYLENSNDRASKYISLKGYFISLLLVLMLLILSLDYGLHHHESPSILIYLLVIIYIGLTINIKRIFEYKLDLFSIIYSLGFTAIIVFTNFEITKINLIIILLPALWFSVKRYLQYINKKA